MAKTEVKFFFSPMHKESLGKKAAKGALSESGEGMEVGQRRVNDSI